MSCSRTQRSDAGEARTRGPSVSSQWANLFPILYGDVSMIIHSCAGKILVQENIAPVDGYVHLVHIFKRRLTWHGPSRNYGNHLYVKIEEYARNKVRLTYD